MSARSSLALIVVALLLGGSAAAQEPRTSAPGPMPEDSVAPAGERGLKCRMSLADGEENVYASDPTATAEPAGGEAVPSEDGGGLSEHLALNLEPTSLRSPNAAGRRLGHGNIVLSVPLNDSMDLRTGVRVDYDSTPSQESFQAGATPTIGVGVEF